LSFCGIERLLVANRETPAVPLGISLGF
jgi:hypothetical protein